MNLVFPILFLVLLISSTFSTAFLFENLEFQCDEDLQKCPSDTVCYQGKCARVEESEPRLQVYNHQVRAFNRRSVSTFSPTRLEPPGDMSSQQQQQQKPKTPSTADGLQHFHHDFVAYLYADHGESFNANVKKLEESTGAKREHFAYGLVALNCVYMIIGSWAEFVCNLIGIAYPAYVSVKAIRTEDTSDDTTWLIYWSVFATFALLDYFAMSIMSIFPFYWVCKALFLVYLYLPQTQGATALYHGFVDPLVSAIDRLMAEKNVPSSKVVSVPTASLPTASVDANNNVVKPQ